jgi:membrane protein DedA with SNARE-associated domain
MDFLPDLETLTEWLTQYGSLFLFVSFTLGILILPVPEETMMLVAGALIKKGKLSLLGAALGASLGSLCGITISYIIGKTCGVYIIHKYGKWVGLSSKRFAKAHKWFEKYGKWSLVIGYFIPGVRHFTGLTAGATELRYRDFALYAYSGALMWVGLFLSSGYFFGHLGFRIFEEIEFTFDNVIIALSVLALIFITYIVISKKIKKRSKR